MPRGRGRGKRGGRTRVGRDLEDEVDNAIPKVKRRGRRGDDDDTDSNGNDDQARRETENRVNNRLKGLDDVADKPARDAILERGGGGGQIRQLGHYADMSVRDLARLAETGTVEQKRAAERALKIIKRATHYRDKQRGSG